MKLYVWDGVLTDWTPGIAFALASSVKEARALIVASRAKELGDAAGKALELELLALKPEVRTGACGFSRSGGG